MTQLLAFLRAVNVGGKNIRMGQLKELFEGIGLANVETFIASGNVAFDSDLSLDSLKESIEATLREAMGYDVTTFLRTREQLAEVRNYAAFSEEELSQSGAFSVGFLEQALTDDQRATLKSLETDIDRFHTHGAEVYWLCKKKQSESKFSGSTFERKLNTRVTFRGANTIARMATRFPAAKSG